MPSQSPDFILGTRALARYQSYVLRRLDASGYQGKSVIGRIMIDGGAVSTYFHSTVPHGVDFARDIHELKVIANALVELSEHNKKQWMAVLLDRVFFPKHSQFKISDKAITINVEPENFRKLVSRGVCFIGSRIMLVDACLKNGYS